MTTTALVLLLALPGHAEQAEEGSSDSTPESKPKAHISFPYNHSLVRANVPIFGAAWAEDFESYRVEFGEGTDPKEWILIRESGQPEPNDPWAQGRVVWNRDWGAKGNLGNWETGLDEYAYGQAWKHRLQGVHTLRLTVKGQSGVAAQHAVEVTVARVLTNWQGGYGQSPDGIMRFQVRPGSLGAAFTLMSILPTEQVAPPKGIRAVTGIYELRPPGLKLVRPAELSFRLPTKAVWEKLDTDLGKALRKLAIYTYDAKNKKWKALPSEARTSSRIDDEAVQEWPKLCATVCREAGKNESSVSEVIWRQLNPGMRRRIREAAKTGKFDLAMRTGLVLAMNQVLTHRDLHKNDRFKNLGFGQAPEPDLEAADKHRGELLGQELKVDPDAFTASTTREREGAEEDLEDPADEQTGETSGSDPQPPLKAQEAAEKLFVSTEAEPLLGQADRLPETGVERLNRLLLEACYPEHLPPSQLDTVLVSTEVTGTEPQVALYGLMADTEAPGPPRLDETPDWALKRPFRLRGSAEPNSTVILRVNDESFETPCGPDGRWESTVSLKEGENCLCAACRDVAGNLGSASPERKIRFEFHHPKRVSSIRILGMQEAAQGNLYAVEVTAKDASRYIDTTLIRVFSSKSDPKGIEVEAIETRARSGVYAGVFRIAGRSDALRGELKAAAHGEKIIAAWAPKPSIRTERAYVDRVPPRAPVVEADAPGATCWDSFEETGQASPEQWQPVDGAFGAIRALKTEKGNRFIRMSPRPGRDGHLGISAHRTEFSVKNHPILSFDFRGSLDAQIDVLLKLTLPAVGWRGIRLTDRAPYYPRIGSFWGVRGSAKWCRAEVNLLSLLQARFPGQPEFRIGEIVFADWSGGGFLFGTKFFGHRADRGGHYDIDNFAITSYRTAGQATFKWEADDDSQIVGYSVALDRRPRTVPPAEVMTTKREKAYEGLQDGRWWFHVRAKDEHGNWGPPNHFCQVIDTLPPEAELITPLAEPIGFEKGIRIAVSDAGAGMDPHRVACQVEGREYRVNGASFQADLQRQSLSLRPEHIQPYPIWFPDGYPIRLKLTNLLDLAGHEAASQYSWTLEAESPIEVKNADSKEDRGWLRTDPEIALRANAAAKWSLCWMRSLKGDQLASRGCYIRELARVPHVARQTEMGGAAPLPIHDGKRRPYFVAEVKVDKAVPETELMVSEVPPAKGRSAGQLISLSHSKYAWRRGGLRGRYYRSPDFKDLLLERIDPFVFFFDERSRFTRRVSGAHSAVWEGAVYVPETVEMDLELAIWSRAPASGRALIDGDVVFELRPEEMAVAGLERKKVLMTEGLHELRLEFREPRGRAWNFALFQYRKGRAYKQELRGTFGAKELFYAENLGTTHFRWNNRPFQAYSQPFPIPLGKNTLSFYTVDHLGRKEPVRTRDFDLKDASSEFKIEVKDGL